MYKQINYLNSLRLLATLFVVLLHTSSAYYGTGLFDTVGFDDSIARLYHYLSTFAVPVFIMISGALFLSKEKDITYANLFRKYVRRVVLALLVFGLPMCFLETLTTGEGVTTALLNFITGHSWTHMWYLYMLICLYLLTPILKPFLLHSSEKTQLVGLEILFTLSILLPTIKSLGVPLTSYIMLTSFPFYYMLGG